MSGDGVQRWTARTDGDVQAAELVRNAAGTVVAWCGGHFNTVAGVDQRKLVAFDADKGTRTGFSTDINSALGVWGLEASGSTLFVGGDFTKADGVPVNRIVSITR